MDEENLEDKIKKLEKLKKEAELKAAKGREKMKRAAAREQEIMTSVKRLESSLPPILGPVKDEGAFFKEEMLELFLYYDCNIRVISNETPTKEEKNISDFNLEMQELIYQRLPKFADVLIHEAEILVHDDVYKTSS
jgi:hypothetical protein